MIGHEPLLTETNSRAWIALCECREWNSGPVAPARNPKTGHIRKAAVELAKGLALTYHGQHVMDVRADVAKRTDVALERHGKLIELANATLQRRGRFGHP